MKELIKTLKEWLIKKDEQNAALPVIIKSCKGCKRISNEQYL